MEYEKLYLASKLFDGISKITQTNIDYFKVDYFLNFLIFTDFELPMVFLDPKN